MEFKKFEKKVRDSSIGGNETPCGILENKNIAIANGYIFLNNLEEINTILVYYAKTGCLFGKLCR